MDIREKLALLKGIAARVDEKYRKREPSPPPVGHGDEIPRLPGFSSQENAHGTAFFRETAFPLGYRHGGICLREALDFPGSVLSFLARDPRMEGFDAPGALFLDTETTGLAGGTGTVAFLVGAGFFREGSFVVRQYFMPDYAFEAPMLLHLKELMSGRGSLVTFNGKTFDIPIIQTRMIMNRIRQEGWEPLHADLLHPCRRLWKEAVGSCRLSSLEEAVLGFAREGDVPGSLIPEIYFQYLRNRDFGPIEKILEHNLSDVVSMAALLVKMWEQVELAQCRRLSDPAACRSLGRIHESRGESAQAAEFYEKALGCGGKSAWKDAVMKSLSLIYKRQGRYGEAVAMWKEMAGGAALDPWAMVELAKHYEHREIDLPAAARYTRMAMEACRARRNLGRPVDHQGEWQQLKHRMDRLERKMPKGSM